MLLFLLACAGAHGADEHTATPTETCEPGWGDLHPCVEDVEGGTEQVGVLVYFEPDGGGETIQGRTGEDGCIRLSLPVGAWQVWAADASGSCSSKPYSAQVEECGFDHFELYTQDQCWDG